MVLSEVSRDPPSPFLTVQSGCDGILPAVPAEQQQQQHQNNSSAGPAGVSGAGRSWDCTQSFDTSSCEPVVSFTQASVTYPRTHLQSIISQQSLNFSVPPDSPTQFEQALNAISASSAVAAGPGECAAQAGQHVSDTPAHADSHKRKVLRFLGGGGWLRSTQSMPHSDVLRGKQPPAAQQQVQSNPHLGQQQALSFKQIHSAVDRPDVAHDEVQQLQLEPVLSRKLKARMHKLLAWASGRASSASASNSPHVPPAQLAPYGSLTYAPAGASSGQQVPIPWQHQVFTEPPVQLIHAAPGTPPVLRSPRSSLVSSPSSCDCPLLLGRYSSTGSEGGYARSLGLATGCSSVSCSQACSLNVSPSPGKSSLSPGAGTAAGSSPVCCSAAASAAAAAPAGPEAPSSLKMTPSVRLAHHRHRQHRPGCRFYQAQHQQQAQQHPQQQTPTGASQQQQQLPQFLQQQQHPPQQTPSSPSTGGLAPQSSLRTALQQLESMASLKAARIMDKLNVGLQKMTSHRVFDGVLRHGTVGKEVMRDWELGPPLGMGASCVTRLVYEKTSGRTAACKSISKQGILHSAAVKASLLAVQREVAILQAVVGHPHVVALHAVYEDVHSLHMIMDWCGGGSLWQLMERCPGYMLPETAAAAATKAVLEVLAHCHARGVMHRDIKPDNLLVQRPLDGPQQLTADLIKVTDFGISVPFTPGQVLTELAGTMGYMAPEVLRRCYTEQADVWSTGVMLYEMVCGQLPFNLGNTCEECLAFVEQEELDLSCPAWQEASPVARELVTAMLAKDASLRPSAQKLLDNYSTWLNQAPQAAQQQQQ